MNESSSNVNLRSRRFIGANNVKLETAAAAVAVGAVGLIERNQLALGWPPIKLIRSAFSVLVRTKTSFCRVSVSFQNVQRRTGER